jgi:hypothetical protein
LTRAGSASGGAVALSISSLIFLFFFFYRKEHKERKAGKFASIGAIPKAVSNSEAQ